MIDFGTILFGVFLIFSVSGYGEVDSDYSNSPARLRLPTTTVRKNNSIPFDVPLPAHAKPTPPKEQASFTVDSSRKSSPQLKPIEIGSAEYLLPEDKKMSLITPENANLNLPADIKVTTTDTGEKISLPAGTYRQIMIMPIDSPLMNENTRTRDLRSPTIETGEKRSRYAEPSTKPIWVRYESLEKIQIGDFERRGGLDIPSHGPSDVGPRVWYAKSETADLASSAFYFVFGGLGYGIANLAGWSAGNTREIPNNLEYRLIRK